MHCTQTSSASGANKIPGSPDTRDQKKTSPTLTHRPKRYALEMWLEVEVGPRLFVPPEDGSYSVNFAKEVINRAYPGCTGMYLDRAGHMLAFYGQKGSTRASLIQDVAIEAGRSVGELPTWMGYTAQWRVRCVSLMEANEILTRCKRLKEAFVVARHLTSQEAAKQWCYYDRKAGAVALQPGDVVMVCTDGFVGKWKVKDWWEDGGFIVESQLEDWPVYKVRCPTTDAKQKPKYQILHRNHLLLVTNEDDAVIPGQ